MAYFIAVVPEGLHENAELVRLYSKFKRTVANKHKEVRWVSPDLWHITIQYLGRLTVEQKEQVVKFLENLKVSKAWDDMELRIHNVGAFPEPTHARTLWLGVQRSQPLWDIKVELQASLKELGLSAEEREYIPHVTLAKFRNFMNAEDLVSLGGRKHFGDYKISEILLLESVIQGHMTKYIPVFRKRILA